VGFDVYWMGTMCNHICKDLSSFFVEVVQVSTSMVEAMPVVSSNQTRYSRQLWLWFPILQVIEGTAAERISLNRNSSVQGICNPACT
jgi:hypothetical protein